MVFVGGLVFSTLDQAAWEGPVPPGTFKVGGIAVHIGARVAAQAQANEVLWRLYAVEPVP